MEEGDLVPGRIGHVLLDPVVNFKLSPFLQQKNAGSSELLGERAKAKLGRGRVGDVPLKIGKTVALVEEYLAVFGDEHRTHELLVRHVELNNFFDSCSVDLGNACAYQQKKDHEPKPHLADWKLPYRPAILWPLSGI